MASNKALQMMYAAQQRVTLGTIQAAIDDILADGQAVTKKRLQERTGFGPSIFAQDYVRNYLDAKGLCQPRGAKKDSGNQKEDSASEKLEKEYRIVLATIQSLKIELEKKEEESKALRAENTRMRGACEEIQGRYDELCAKLKAHGIDVGRLE